MGQLTNLIGKFFKIVYDSVESLGIGGSTISNYAIAVIIMGLVYKIISLPMTIRSAKSSKMQIELKPEADKIKQKYGYDREIYQRKMQEFQKKHNMAKGIGGTCLTFIVNIIIVIALFNVMKNPHEYLPGFESINKSFFWINDLNKMDPTGFVLPLINSLSQLGYQYLIQNKMQSEAQPGGMQTVMYVMPIMFFFIFRTMPSGLILYWTIGNLVEILIRGSIKLFVIFRSRSQA